MCFLLFGLGSGFWFTGLVRLGFPFVLFVCVEFDAVGYYFDLC